MKHTLILTLIISGLIANTADERQAIEITPTSKVEMYTALF